MSAALLVGTTEWRDWTAAAMDREMPTEPLRQFAVDNDSPIWSDFAASIFRLPPWLVAPIDKPAAVAVAA